MPCGTEYRGTLGLKMESWKYTARAVARKHRFQCEILGALAGSLRTFIVAFLLLMSPAVLQADYDFGQWAQDTGLSITDTRADARGVGLTSLEGIENFPNIAKLYVNSNRLTGIGPYQLVNNPNLKILNLSDNPWASLDFSGAVLTSLINLKFNTSAVLTSVIFDDVVLDQKALDEFFTTKSGDAGIGQYAETITSLSFSGTDLADTDLSALSSMTSVTELNLQGTGLEAAEIVELISIMPDMDPATASVIVDLEIAHEVIAILAEDHIDTTVVPEPASISILAAAAFLLMKRRKR